MPGGSGRTALGSWAGLSGMPDGASGFVCISATGAAAVKARMISTNCGAATSNADAETLAGASVSCAAAEAEPDEAFVERLLCLALPTGGAVRAIISETDRMCALASMTAVSIATASGGPDAAVPPCCDAAKCDAKLSAITVLPVPSGMDGKGVIGVANDMGIVRGRAVFMAFSAVAVAWWRARPPYSFRCARRRRSFAQPYRCGPSPVARAGLR